MKKLLGLLSISMLTMAPVVNIFNNNVENQIENTEHNYLEAEGKKCNKDGVQSSQKVVMNIDNIFAGNGVAFENKLYFSAKDSIYEYDPAANKDKICTNRESYRFFPGVVCNDKLYFVANHTNCSDISGRIYSYIPSRNSRNLLIADISCITSNAIVLNDKLYFSCKDGKVYEYDPLHYELKIVIQAEYENYSFSSNKGVVWNNKIYFDSEDYNVYEYDPATGKQKTVIRGDSAFKDTKIVWRNKLYICSKSGQIYEYDCLNDTQRVIIWTKTFHSLWVGANWQSSTVFRDKIYFSADNKVYEYDPEYDQYKLAWAPVVWETLSKGIALNDKLYFNSSTGKVYEYDPTIIDKKEVFTPIRMYSKIEEVNPPIIWNNKVYIGGRDYNLYEYDPTTKRQRTVLMGSGQLRFSGIILNDRLYLPSTNLSGTDNKVYEYSEIYNLSSKIKFQNISNTGSNTKEALMLEISYLDQELDTSQLEIVDIIDTSFKIQAKKESRKYCGSQTINYGLKQEPQIFDLKELIKRGIFFKLREQDLKFSFKDIKIINFGKSRYKSFELKQIGETVYDEIAENICSELAFRENPSKEPMQFKSKGCTLTSIVKSVLQVTRGLKFSQSNSQTSSQKSNWGFQIGINGDGKVGIGKIMGEFGQEMGSSVTKRINVDFDLGDAKTKETTETVTQEIPSQEITILPNQKIKLTNTVRKISAAITLALTQKAGGVIEVFMKDGTKLSFNIVELMEKLAEIRILPSEITINNKDKMDWGITFHGRAKVIVDSGTYYEFKPEISAS